MSIDLLPPTMSHYYVVEGDGVRFRDIVNAVPLDADGVHPAIAKDRYWGPGISYLRQACAAGRLTLLPILGEHGGAEDFEEMVTQHGDVFERAAFVGVQMDWRRTSRQGEPVMLKNIEYKFSTWGPGRVYQHAQMEWLLEQKSRPLPCEREIDDTEPLSVELAKVGHIFTDVETVTGFSRDDPEGNAVRVLAMGIWESYRQLGAFAQLGFWLKELDKTGQFLQDAHTEVPIMLGPWFQAGLARISALGISLQTPRRLERHTLSGRPEVDAYGDTYDSIIRTSRVDAAQLRTPLPF